MSLSGTTLYRKWHWCEYMETRKKEREIIINTDIGPPRFYPDAGVCTNCRSNGANGFIECFACGSQAVSFIDTEFEDGVAHCIRLLFYLIIPGCVDLPNGYIVTSEL